MSNLERTSPHINVYTDGGCRNNGQKNNIGGYGIVIDAGSTIPHFEDYAYEFNTTNNRMELEAVVKSLVLLYGVINWEYLYPSVTIYTDSNYVVQAACAWVYNWKRNGWTTANGGEVANQDLWVRYLDAVRDFKDVMVLHIPRDSHPLNVKADALANKAMDEGSTRR